MDVTFLVPMQYYSLQHWTLFPSPVTSKTGYCFSLALSLHFFWSYFMGFSRQEHQSCLPFPSPVGHVLSELSTMTRPSSVALHSMANSFIELDEAVVHEISFVSFLWLRLEFVYTVGVSDGQGSLACCWPWGCRESDRTEWLNWTEWEQKTPNEEFLLGNRKGNWRQDSQTWICFCFWWVRGKGK